MQSAATGDNNTENVTDRHHFVRSSHNTKYHANIDATLSARGDARAWCPPVAVTHHGLQDATGCLGSWFCLRTASGLGRRVAGILLVAVAIPQAASRCTLLPTPRRPHHRVPQRRTLMRTSGRNMPSSRSAERAHLDVVCTAKPSRFCC